MKQKILFVCLGNICRSPSAEGVMQQMVNMKGLNSEILIDSAGTSGYHVGENADERMSSHAIKRGYRLTSISRQVRYSDYDEFDYIIAMDQSNFDNLHRMAKNEEQRNKIHMMTDFSHLYDGDVPDPYYGGSQGFENVLDILEDSCEGLLEGLEY